MGSEMISHPKKVRVKGGEGWVELKVAFYPPLAQSSIQSSQLRV